MSIICRPLRLSPPNFSLEWESQETCLKPLKRRHKTNLNIDHATHSDFLLHRSRNENKPRLAADSLAFRRNCQAIRVSSRRSDPKPQARWASSALWKIVEIRSLPATEAKLSSRAQRGIRCGGKARSIAALGMTAVPPMDTAPNCNNWVIAYIFMSWSASRDCGSISAAATRRRPDPAGVVAATEQGGSHGRTHGRRRDPGQASG